MHPLPTLKKLAFEPGVLFPIANIFAFAQSGSLVAVGLAVVNVALAVAFTLGKKPPLSPMRLTALLALLSGLFSFASLAWLAGCAGLAFGTGNFLASSPSNMAALRAPGLHPCRRALAHPAIYYGIGYCLIGIMAGGSAELLAHPLDHGQALTMVILGAVTIVVASLGLALGFMKTAIPFWILACGTGINALAGLVSGNYVGAGSPLFAMFGEVRLGFMTREEPAETQAE